jgi:hypothetical protein
MTKEEQFLDETFFNEELEVRTNGHVLETEGFERPETYLNISPYSLTLLEKVKTAFIKAGWDGKGDLGLMYVKPFTQNLPPEKVSPNTLGTFIWHVRQDKDGKSFLGTYPNSLKSVAYRSEIIYNDD